MIMVTVELDFTVFFVDAKLFYNNIIFKVFSLKKTSV